MTECPNCGLESTVESSGDSEYFCHFCKKSFKAEPEYIVAVVRDDRGDRVMNIEDAIEDVVESGREHGEEINDT